MGGGRVGGGGQVQVRGGGVREGRRRKRQEVSKFLDFNVRGQLRTTAEQEVGQSKVCTVNRRKGGQQGGGWGWRRGGGDGAGEWGGTKSRLRCSLNWRRMIRRRKVERRICTN